MASVRQSHLTNRQSQMNIPKCIIANSPTPIPIASSEHTVVHCAGAQMMVFRFLKLSIALAFACGMSFAAQAPGGDPAYVVRGKQTEVGQRAFADRLARFHDALAEALQHN